jgi:hypothetical protein
MMQPHARRVLPRFALIAASAALMFAVGCTTVKSAVKTPVARTLDEGEVIGGAGGNGTVTAVESLVSADCAHGTLILKTNLNAILALMDCTQQPPQAALERFIGLPVTITYTNDKLRLAKSSGETLDFAVKDATVTHVNAAP